MRIVQLCSKSERVTYVCCHCTLMRFLKISKRHSDMKSDWIFEKFDAPNFVTLLFLWTLEEMPKSRVILFGTNFSQSSKKIKVYKIGYFKISNFSKNFMTIKEMLNFSSDSKLEWIWPKCISALEAQCLPPFQKIKNWLIMSISKDF